MYIYTLKIHLSVPIKSFNLQSLITHAAGKVIGLSVSIADFFCLSYADGVRVCMRVLHYAAVCVICLSMRI